MAVFVGAWQKKSRCITVKGFGNCLLFTFGELIQFSMAIKIKNEVNSWCVSEPRVNSQINSPKFKRSVSFGGDVNMKPNVLSFDGC